MLLFNMFLQSSSCAPSKYMSQQSDINERMRGILIDWLIEVRKMWCFSGLNLGDEYLISCSLTEITNN